MRKIIVIFSTIIPIFAIVALFSDQYFSMHDRQHIVRLFLLDKGLGQGLLYPRYVDGLGFGFGYPLFNFYPPLIYYIAEIFRLVGFGYVVSIKLMLILGFYISFTGMYLLLNKLLKKPYIALLGATLFLFAPYHAVLVFVRGAFAEFFAYNLIPWIFWAFLKLSENNKRYYFSIFIALLILAHPLVAFPFLLIFGVFFLVYLLCANNKLDLIIKTVFAFLVGLGLSAFFWLPSLFERKYTLVDKILTNQLANYNLHFVYLRQFFNSSWGFGGSIYGLWDGMSFEIGKIHLALSLISVVGLFVCLLKGEKSCGLILKKALPYLTIFVVAVFMSSFYSKIVWDNVHYLWYLQFPWRFLVFATFASSLSGVLILVFIENNKIRGVLAGLIIVLSIMFYAPLFKPEKFIDGADESYITKEQINWEVSKTSYEFMYNEVSTVVNDDNTTSLKLQKNEIPTISYIKNENLKVKQLEDKYIQKKYKVKAKKKTKFVINTSYFPGWNVYVNGNKQFLSKTGKIKLLSVELKPGLSEVEFRFENTTPRTVANLLSIFVLVLLILVAVKNLLFHRK